MNEKCLRRNLISCSVDGIAFNGNELRDPVWRVFGVYGYLGQSRIDRGQLEGLSHGIGME